MKFKIFRTSGGFRDTGPRDKKRLTADDEKFKIKRIVTREPYQDERGRQWEGDWYFEIEINTLEELIELYNEIIKDSFG